MAMIETIKFNTFSWMHILNPSDENFDYLIENYNFHPLDIEDCRSKVQRPKIDIYDDYYFLILHFPVFDKTNKFLDTKEVKIFWGKEFIITIGNSHWIVKKFFNSVKEDLNAFKLELSSETSDALLYEIMERLMKETLALIGRIDSEVEQINYGLFRAKSDKIIEKISVTRKNIILLDTNFRPQLRLFHKFESGEVKGFAEDMEEYWGNILDYYQKLWDVIEDDKELIEGLAKTYDSLQTNRINEIIKILTLISTVMLPMTFIASLYGMNINLPFQSHSSAFLIVSGVMLAVVIVFLCYFIKKKWL
ncbi:MAG: magnesium transporter CorA family protein [Bacteroidales bacterium]|jgi:magnesium transporter|nr:magnesium transporter CorA family protein [Bacteroidales bacterium]MDD4214723.1 magnesium transporter CorA family protein [Bacteroidales bacterium]